MAIKCKECFDSGTVDVLIDGKWSSQPCACVADDEEEEWGEDNAQQALERGPR